MKFHMQDGAAEVRLSRAILLYEHANGGGYGSDHQTVLATIHKVEHVATDKGPNVEIQAGHPITKTGLMEALGDLADIHLSTMDLFPENLLGHSPQHLLWWCPAGKRSVFFRSSTIGERAAVVPHPALLFLVVNGRWYVFALRESKRPTLDTQVCHSPYFNVYDNGSICVGSMIVPKNATPSTIPQWEEAFFRSEFTHRNGALRKVSHSDGETTFWTEMLDGKYSDFPCELLVPMNETDTTTKTVATLLRQVAKKGEYQ